MDECVYHGRSICGGSDEFGLEALSNHTDNYNGRNQQLSHLECAISRRDHMQYKQGVCAGHEKYHRTSVWKYKYFIIFLVKMGSIH